MPESVDNPAPVRTTTRRPVRRSRAGPRPWSGAWPSCGPDCPLPYVSTAAGYAVAAPSPWRGRQSGLEPHRPVDPAQPHGELPAAGLDGHLTEELEALRRRGVLDPWRLVVDRAGPKGAVQDVGPEGAGVQRSGHELPERVEVLVGRPLRRVVVGRRVVDVRGQPDVVADPVPPEEGQDPRELAFASERTAGVALGKPLLVHCAVRHDESERKVVGDDLPQRAGPAQAALQPGDLRVPEHALVRQALPV